MRILINTPKLSAPGGVSNHYMGLKKYWKEQVKYNYIGSRKVMPGWIVFPLDLLIYIFNIITFKPHIIIINPSLGVKAIKRDYFFFQIAILFKKKPIIFIHGWDQSYADEIHLKPLYLKKWFNEASCILVLSSNFKNQLERLNIIAPIYITSTKVDDEYLKSFDINSRDGIIRNILFLSRVEEDKGIFIALEVYKMLKASHLEIKFFVAGSGSALDRAKKFVSENKLRGVTFFGHITGDKLIEALRDSQLYLFPTFFPEGLPTSILEAMAFGLPVITRPVGGIRDFFVNDKMGYLIESKDPFDFYNAIEALLLDPEKCKRISHYNNFYARKNFMASKIAREIETIAKGAYKT